MSTRSFVVFGLLFTLGRSRHFDDDNDSVRRTNEKIHKEMHPKEDINADSEERTKRLQDHVNALQTNLEKQKLEEKQMRKKYEIQLSEKDKAWEAAMNYALAVAEESIVDVINNNNQNRKNQNPIIQCFEEVRNSHTTASKQKQMIAKQLLNVQNKAIEDQKELSNKLKNAQQIYNQAILQKELKMKEHENMKKDHIEQMRMDILEENVSIEQVQKLKDKLTQLEHLFETKKQNVKSKLKENEIKSLYHQIELWSVNINASFISIIPFLLISMIYYYSNLHQKKNKRNIKPLIHVLVLFLSKILCFFSILLTIFSYVFKNDIFNEKIWRNNNDHFLHYITKSIQSQLCLFFVFEIIFLLIGFYFNSKKSFKLVFMKMIQVLLIFSMFCIHCMVLSHGDVEETFSKYFISSSSSFHIVLMYGYFSVVFAVLLMLEQSIHNSQDKTSNESSYDPNRIFSLDDISKELLTSSLTNEHNSFDLNGSPLHNNDWLSDSFEEQPKSFWLEDQPSPLSSFDGAGALLYSRSPSGSSSSSSVRQRGSASPGFRLSALVSADLNIQCSPNNTTSASSSFDNSIHEQSQSE